MSRPHQAREAAHPAASQSADSPDLTIADIDDIALDSSWSARDRRRQLLMLLQEADQRSTSDRFNTNGMEQVASHLHARIAWLGNSQDSGRDEGKPANHSDEGRRA